MSEDGSTINRDLHKCFTNRGGFLHREDGPALVRKDGKKEWWISGRRIHTQAELQQELKLTDEQMLEFALKNETFI